LINEIQWNSMKWRNKQQTRQFDLNTC
jgi:hypothetical protein